MHTTAWQSSYYGILLPSRFVTINQKDRKALFYNWEQM